MTAQKPQTPPLTAARIAVGVLGGPLAFAVATAVAAAGVARALGAGRRPGRPTRWCWAPPAHTSRPSRGSGDGARARRNATSR